MGLCFKPLSSYDTPSTSASDAAIRLPVVATNPPPNILHRSVNLREPVTEADQCNLEEGAVVFGHGEIIYGLGRYN